MLEEKYFTKFSFTKEQISKYADNALKDLAIAERDTIVEVKFNYAYSAFIKAGITLLSYHQLKIKSIPGHHVKIIEKIALYLKDKTISAIGNVMRSKRNLDLYEGGITVTEKECSEYLKFVQEVLKKTLYYLRLH